MKNGNKRQRAKDPKSAPRPDKKTKRGPLGLVASLALLGVIYTGALAFLAPASPGRSVSYDELNRYAVCGGSAPSTPSPERLSYCQGASAGAKVTSVALLDQDARITGTLVRAKGNPAERFWTAYPKSDAATNDLLRVFVNSRTKVTVDAQSTKAVVRFLAQFLLPLVILANLFAIVFSLSKGGGGGAAEFLGFGRIGNKRMKGADKARTTFADVAAAQNTIIELSEVRDYLADPSSFEAMGALPPKGVLLMGPPGCGKTLLARAVAGEAEAAFFTMSGSEFVESLVGVGAARVRDLFAQARASAPAIIFIDELDAAGRQRGAGLGGGNDEREQTLNEMLVQMDGFSPTDGVVVLGATNRADILDPALLRAGRFDRHITVERPDAEGRLAILALHAQSRRLADADAHLPRIARRTPGFTGADLANVLNEAALLAVRERAGAIGLVHLEEAVERVLSGPKRQGQIISEDEKARIAYHEAGHAVVAAAFGKVGAIERISIIARGRGVGHLAVLSEDKTILTRTDMVMQISVAMAGIAAEELVFGEPSTGAESDLGRATDAARDMAGRFGMSTRVGRVRILHEQHEVFLGRDYLSTRDVSQPTMEHLDAEIRRILDEEESTAHEILAAHREVLDRLAADLMVRETLEGPQLVEMLAGVAHQPAPVKPSSNSRPARVRR